MTQHTQQRKICDSWYHQRWFRILLIIVGVDMIILGGTFVMGIDLVSIVTGIHVVWRILGGLAYVLVALFIIHYALLYSTIREKSYLLCQHCAHVAIEKEGK